MRKKLIVLMMVISSFSAYGQLKYSKVRIYSSLYELKVIRQCGIDLENISGKPGLYIDAEISEVELSKIADKGFKYEILIDNMSEFYKNRYESSVLKNKNALNGIKYVTPVNFNYGSMGGFLTLSEIYAELDQMKTLYPDLITIKYTIGNTQTYDGRSIYAVKISDNPDTNEDEPEVLYTSLTHAREPAAMQGLIWFMWYLLENYESDSEINYLVNNLEMYFVPAVNPDGYEYNRTTDPNGGGMWRKNKRDNNGGGFGGYGDGVDLNRNFGYNWGYDNEGSSPNGSDETYRGTAGFSEPETQILRDFCNDHQFVMAHNHHTYSGLLIIPWGYDEIFTPDDAYYRASANLMASENGYTVGQGWQILYVVNGDSNDWMYGEQGTKPKIFAYTQETGSSGFWPEQSEIIQLCEECFLPNLYLARFTTPYAELSDNTPAYIPRTGYIKFNLKRMGLSGSGSYTVTIEPDNAIFSTLGSAKEIQLNTVMSSQTDSILYVLSDDIEYGETFNYTVTVNTGTYALSKTFSKSYYLTEIILEDPGNTTGNWTTSEWSATDESFWSPSSSITDSEGGDYSSNENNSITLVNQISLAGIENPQLSFWAKWNIENNWDYVQFFISTNNGSSWTPLATNKTNLGTGSFQPNGQPLFDASENWCENTVDLNAYVGQNVKFRFELHSDGSVEEDGFYFDDFTISSTLSSPLAASLTATPGCGANSGTITIYSTVSGTQTFYLRDNSGNPISDWTGDADFHEFNGLDDGTYKAQIEQEGEMSTLTDGIELQNITTMPEMPESVQSTDNLICSGENITLSYTGGSGQVFEWFETSCGEGIIGNGNNLIVNPTVETTYYGRWSNACGNSECLSLTITIADPTDITSDPEDINASQGDNISFEVEASGNNLSYQWRKNGGSISGANESNYSINNVQVSDQGLYDVIVSGECGDLTSESATLTVSTGISDQSESEFDIYPNPTTCLFTIKTHNITDKFEYDLKDINGKTLLKGVNRSGQTTLSLKNSNTGMYFLHIRVDSKLYVYKIIKH